MKKNDSLNQSNSNSYFWFCAVLLCVLLVSILARDITRPFTGLHSWGQASGAWQTRVHIKYGLCYTKGVSTWAVGYPPTKSPKRYFDHPQLGGILNWLYGSILGIHEWTFRVVGIFCSIIVMLLFLKILKGLIDEKTALLSGLILAIFPITGYFSTGGWTTILCFSAIWFYLVLINALKGNPTPSLRHKIGLAACLFLGLQITWTGFFYAFAIGLHYVCRCLKHRRWPDWSLIAIMIIAPFSSMAVTFTIMAAGYGWDISKIIELYKWRAGNAEVAAATAKFDWQMWFETLWKHSLTNYTMPVVLAALAYITIGQVFVFVGPKDTQTGRFKCQFPQFWLFIVPAVSQLFALRGCLWKHQTWLHPFDPFVAIAAALFVMLVFDFVKRINFKLAVVTILLLLGLFTGFCITGTNYYYAIRWQAPSKIRMFKMLNQKIPPDKDLLSFEDFIVNQHKSKGAFYRPEIAWYLDRDIVPARTLIEIEEYAKEGKCPYYLMPLAHYNAKVSAHLTQLSNQLRKRYQYEYIAGELGEKTKDGKFLKAGMVPYMIFDLTSTVSNIH